VQQLVDRVNACMEAAALVLDRSCRVYVVLAEPQRPQQQQRQLLALAVLQPIREAYGAAPHPEDPGLACVLAPGGPARPAALGVARVWVAPGHRRCGLAVQLLDAARRTFARPLVVARRALAFSQPTASGFALAARYQAGCFEPGVSCLVYR
jgi:hypothetical protein